MAEVGEREEGGGRKEEEPEEEDGEVEEDRREGGRRFGGKGVLDCRGAWPPGAEARLAGEHRAGIRRGAGPTLERMDEDVVGERGLRSPPARPIWKAMLT